MHAVAGFPVRSTWLKAIKNGNFNSWPGLTYNNAAKYCPQSVETIKVTWYNLPKESDPQKVSATKYITIKLRGLSNNQTQTI